MFSPRLDPVGNSLRGVAVYRQLAADLHLHFLNAGRSNRATVSMAYALADVPSTRRRGAAERAVIDAQASSVLVLQLTGDVLFSGAESLSRTALVNPARFVILDLSRVGVVDAAASRLLAELSAELSRGGGELVLANAEVATVDAVRARSFAGVDAAKEWCETQVLARAGADIEHAAVTVAEHPICARMSPAQTGLLAELVDVREFPAGSLIISAGASAAEVFLLLAGEASVSIATANGSRRRLSTLSPGSVFGESAVTGVSMRTADVVAETPTRCGVLPAAAIAAADPALRAAILSALLDIAHEALARATREIAALSR